MEIKANLLWVVAAFVVLPLMWLKAVQQCRDGGSFFVALSALDAVTNILPVFPAVIRFAPGLGGER